MQKSDNFLYIGKVVLSLVEKNDRIARILNKDVKLEKNEIELIEKNYKEKKNLVDTLDKWFNSDAGKASVSEDPETWAKLIQPLLEKEKANVENLKNRTDELSGMLREIIKKKSLLIYTKNQ